MRIIVILLATIFVFLPIDRASAHVLLTDETGSKGAILHIIPDDDPIAGEQATLFFDAQDQIIQPNSTVNLSIKNEDGNDLDVETEVDGTLVTADFIFPQQGVYGVTYTITTNGSTYIFSQSQRVSRGVANSRQTEKTYSWAEFLLVGSSVSLVFLMIIAFNRRKDIARQSKF